MTDSSQEVNTNSEEKDTNEAAKTADNDDIQFEETLDIDDIQKKLFEKIDQEKQGIADTEDEDVDLEELKALMAVPEREEEKKEIVPAEQKPKASKNAKKYVIYIDSENIEFMEGLSQSARKDLINSILKEQNEAGQKAKMFRERKQYITHVLLACITFIVFFPILFMIVNKSTEATIENYNQARQNFGKLYKKQGKIKLKGTGDDTPTSEY